MTPAGRADRPLVLAIDIGSSSVRAAFHDRRGRTVRGTEVQVPVAWDVGDDRSVRISHPALLDTVDQALDRVVERAGPLVAEAAAAGISCFFHSIVGLDGRGRPLTPVVSWADSTSAAEAAELRTRIDPERAHQLSGVPIHASYWPARVLRLRGEQPRVARWVGAPELVLDRLVGRRAVTRSMASGTGLLDRARGTWSTELLRLIDVDPDDLARIVDDDEPMGTLSRVAARRWPALAHLTWFAPWGDGSCGNVGLGATTPDRAALMVGTSGALRTAVDDPAPAIPPGLFAYRLGPGTIVGGQLSEGGGVLAWASRRLGRSRASLERAAAALPADGHGLTVLPYPFGERGLGYHDQAQATLEGLRPDTDPAATYRAILEAMAFGFAAVDDRLGELLGHRPAITASGGALAGSPLLAQVLADALGRELTVAPRFEASRHGAAILALRATGLLGATDPLPRPRSRLVRPDPARVATYVTARARQRALYESVLG